MTRQQTKPEKTTCRYHPERILRYVWAWDDADGSTVEDSEPEYLDACPDCERDARKRMEYRIWFDCSACGMKTLVAQIDLHRGITTPRIKDVASGGV